VPRDGAGCAAWRAPYGQARSAPFTNLSERKLMDCLNRLGYDIEIKVRPAAEPIGHLTLATA